jgi:hypothetical protein
MANGVDPQAATPTCSAMRAERTLATVEVVCDAIGGMVAGVLTWGQAAG